MPEKTQKSTSLTELGFKIEAASGKDEQGNDIAYTVVGPAPVFYVKKTKRGRLFATRDLASTTESTIEGLYNFKEQNGDLVGQRATPQVATATPRKKQPKPTPAAA